MVMLNVSLPINLTLSSLVILHGADVGLRAGSASVWGWGRAHGLCSRVEFVA